MFAVRSSRLVSFVYLGTIVGLVGFFGEAAIAQPYKTAVGYNQLVTELGGSLETGAGLNIALVEASFGAANRYMPDTTNVQFTGKTITAGSGASNGNSNHALTVGQYFFGNSSSMTPGVTNITGFEANDWINTRLAPGGGGTPLTENFRVSNHSYVARTADITEANAVNLSMRMDYYINQSGTTVVVGTDNAATMPRLFMQGYNSISVGKSVQSTTAFSSGFTNLYGSGRVKPEIVVSLDEGTGMDFTSFSTAIVSSAATLLHAKADNMGANAADARRPEVVKSILMSGATKEAAMNWDRTNTRPLDETYGAGQLNIRNSYNTMHGGQFNGHLSSSPSSQIGLRGWDYEASLAGNTSMFYEFAVGSGGVQDISMMLNWNIQVTDTDPGAIFLPSATLANLSLSLLDSSSNVIDFSNSAVDNLEHLSLASLNAGTYRMRVDNLSSSSSSFALSWRMTAVPEPGSGGVLLLFAMGLLARRGRRQRAQL